MPLRRGAGEPECAGVKDTLCAFHAGGKGGDAIAHSAGAAEDGSRNECMVPFPLIGGPGINDHQTFNAVTSV